MGYDLCLVKQAEHPFLVESTGTSLYSIEELCYYLYHNPDLVDDTIMGAPLCAWLKDELGLDRLSASLRSQIMKNESGGSVMMHIFREIGYLSADESRRFSEFLARLDTQPGPVRRKRRADALASNRMYVKAVRAYQELLLEKENENLGAQFYSDVRCNLGSVYAAQFLYREASDCYYRAWKTGRKKEYLRRYLSTLPLFLTEEEYQKKLVEEGIDSEYARTVQERNAAILQRAEASGEAALPGPEELRSFLKKQRDDWRNSMAG